MKSSKTIEVYIRMEIALNVLANVYNLLDDLGNEANLREFSEARASLERVSNRLRTGAGNKVRK